MKNKSTKRMALGLGLSALGLLLVACGGTDPQPEPIEDDGPSIADGGSGADMSGAGGGDPDPEADADQDGVADSVDNCLNDANADQIDTDGDSEGDACDFDDDGDNDPDETDCAPLDASVHATAVETCNDIDDNCDGVIDPEDSDACTVYFADVDGDGFGVAGDSLCLCAPEGDYAATSDEDCDDDDFDVNPDGTELCNGVDDNCSGAVDELWSTLGTSCDGSDADMCQDGAIVCTADGLGAVCSDGPTTPGGAEVCNGADDDCNGTADDPWAATLGTPCDGSDADSCANGTLVCNASGSGTTCQGDSNIIEICDGNDNDCDGIVDEGCDDDNDNYCDKNMTIIGTPATCSNGGGDCNDSNSNINPGRSETCNGIDDDCDGLVDASDPEVGWPSLDSYEPNDATLLAKELSEFSNYFTPFGPTSSTSFHGPSDSDYFFWDDLSNQIPPQYMLCRVTGMSSSTRVNIYMGYRRSGDPPFPYVYSSGTCTSKGNGGSCAKTIANPTVGPNEYNFYVGVTPSSGVNECAADYDIECKLSNSSSW